MINKYRSQGEENREQRETIPNLHYPVCFLTYGGRKCQLRAAECRQPLVNLDVFEKLV